MLYYACSALSTPAALLAFGCTCVSDPVTAGQTAQISAAIDAASDMLCILSGLRITGRCQTVVHPFNNDCNWGSPHRLLGEWPTLGAPLPMRGMDLIPLRGPQTEIVQIVIGGVTLPTSAYRLVDHRNLLRIDGGSWPRSNSFVPTSTDYWTVEYRFGPIPDKITSDATNELACELIKDWTHRETNLPPGITSLNLQGVNAQLEDAADALRDGSENLRAVARFLGIYNSTETRFANEVWSPELDMGWELYDIEGPSGS